MKKLYYHASPSENCGKILCDGIKPDRMGEVFLADSAENALKFLVIRDYKNLVVFEFELDDSEVHESFDHSESFFKCKAWICNRQIDPDEILEVYQYVFS